MTAIRRAFLVISFLAATSQMQAQCPTIPSYGITHTLTSYAINWGSIVR